MSNYYRIRCSDHGLLMGEESPDDGNEYDGFNHGHGQLIEVIARASVLAPLADDFTLTPVGGPCIELDWLGDHKSCELQVMSEYDDHWYDASGAKHEKETD